MEVQLYTPYNKQVQVHQGCDNESYIFDTVCASRQTGKTMLAQNQVIKWALENKNVTIMWVSPTNSQVNKVYKNIIQAVGDSPMVKSHKATAGDIEIVFSTGSIIKFKSAAAEDGLRGETVHYMVIDEVAFIKETTFMEILLPMLNTAGRKCLVISTPKGKSNWFHKHFMRGKQGDRKYKSYHFNCYDNPFANADIIATAKSSMPGKIFQQEYLAEFVDGGMVFENINEVCVTNKSPIPKPGQSYYAGIDLALKNDYTVFTVVDSEGDMVWYDRFNQITGPELKERLVRNIRTWKPVNTLVELNNMGQVIYDDLKYMYEVKNLQGWNTTYSSKNEMLMRLLNAFAEKSLTCPDDDILKAELETFEMTITSSGKIHFAAAEGFHDDMVMSLAIAREAQAKAINNRFNLTFV